MKVYRLTSHSQYNSIVLCNDIFLIELFIAQRRLTDNTFCITEENRSKACKLYSNYLVYYHGYAITRNEKAFIITAGKEEKYEMKRRRKQLALFLKENKANLSKKDIYAIKETMNDMKHKHIQNETHQIENIETILRYPFYVKEYLDNYAAYQMLLEEEE